VTIYISSTYQDLKDYRGTVDKQLRSMGHKVIAMETYVASDDRPLDRCVADVRSVDDDIRVSHASRNANPWPASPVSPLGPCGPALLCGPVAPVAQARL